MNTVTTILKMNERQLKSGSDASWHDRYKSSSWVFVGGLSPDLCEGDVICVFSEWGEVEDIHLIRDKDTGKSKGFAFLKYEDFRSTVLAVDNFNGVLLLGKTLRVDHKLDYNPPQKKKKDRGPEDLGPKAFQPGHAYAGKELKANGFDINSGAAVFGNDGEIQKQIVENKLANNVVQLNDSESDSDYSSSGIVEDDVKSGTHNHKKNPKNESKKKKRKREKHEKKAKKKEKKKAKKAKKKLKKMAKKKAKITKSRDRNFTKMAMQEENISHGVSAPSSTKNKANGGVLDWRGQ